MYICSHYYSIRRTIQGVFSVLLQYTGIEINKRNVQSGGILKFVLFTLLTNQITLQIILKA